MRAAKVYYKGEEAGFLTQLDDASFVFRYDDPWFANPGCPPISLTLPKTKQEHHSDFLFPFFYNLLPEGTNREVVCRYLRIDEADYFGILLATAKYDTIGAVTVSPINIAA